MSKNLPKLIAIVGETATGKSALALAIAQRFKGEIINADSRQIYRGLDIGTAKPTAAERAEIPHHLLDVVDPDQPFSAAAFKKLTLSAISDIANRQKLPILVGGTGLYVNSVLFDYRFLPPNQALRKAFSRLTSTSLLAHLNQQGIDITGVDIKNKRRLVRLLETGGAKLQNTSKMRLNTLVVGLKLNSRAKLRANIEKRVENMFRCGLRHEVESLTTKYGWDNEAMRGIGYREFQAYFDGKQSLNTTRRQIVQATLNLAKRQRTWFKRNAKVIWLTDPKQATSLVKSFLSS